MIKIFIYCEIFFSVFNWCVKPVQAAPSFPLSKNDTSAEMSGINYEKLDYPELSVVPRASVRLGNEALEENHHQWTTYLPLQVSALSTFCAGLLSNGNMGNGDSRGTLGMVVGGTWLVTSVVLSLTYRPYQSIWKNVTGLKQSTIREQLTRERAAEEGIRRTADLGKKLEWLSIGSQFLTSVYLLSKSSPHNPSVSQGSVSSTVQAFQLAAVLFSIAPLIFPFYWNEVYEDQINYKKRIYAPVAGVLFFENPLTHQWTPGMSLAWQF